MKPTSLFLVLLISPSNSISGGNTGSDQNAKSTMQKADPRIEKSTKEMNNYLNKIVHKSKTRSEIENHLKSLINRDVQNPKIFPILNSLMVDEANHNDQEFISALCYSVSVNLKSHIENKCKELKFT